ncbi:hypothetical protein [Streptomyces mirabilis]|uniref:hypothetical protein n=1 Tax=Streptomyces mirabilis TaxID=68239 RepID=UPI0036B50AEC
MAALRLVSSGGELLAGTGRVTLSRTGGGAGFGAYALLYTTRTLPGGGVEAVIAATRPEDTDPAWHLADPQPHGPQTSETRPLLKWAAALNERKKNEPAAGYRERLAIALVTTAWTTRIVPPPDAVDLPLAAWEMETEHLISVSYASHTAVRIGHLVTLTAKTEA